METPRKDAFCIVLAYTYGTKQEQEISCHGHNLAEVQTAYKKHCDELKQSRVYRWKSATLYTPTGTHRLAHPDNVVARTKAERLPKHCQVIALRIGEELPTTLHALTQGSVSLSPAGYLLTNGERVFLRTDKVGKIRLIWQGVSCKVYARKSGKKSYEIHIQRPQEKVPACKKSGWQAQTGVCIIRTKRQQADREKRAECIELAG